MPIVCHRFAINGLREGNQVIQAFFEGDIGTLVTSCLSFFHFWVAVRGTAGISETASQKEQFSPFKVIITGALSQK